LACNLDAHKVVLTLQPAAAAFIAGIEPTGSNHCKQDVALRDLGIELSHEVHAGLYVINVHEQSSTGKALGEMIE
jgi:hypothetical protein